MEILNATRYMDENQKRVYYEQNKKSEVLMTILSLVIPGLGQMVMGKILKGILILLFSWLFIPWIYGIYDAYKSSKEYNQELYALLFGAGYQQPAAQAYAPPPNQQYQQPPNNQQPPQSPPQNP